MKPSGFWVAFLSLTLWTACSASPPSKTVLRMAFWGDLSEIEATISVVSEFERLHPGITVKLDRPPNYLLYLESQFKLGTAPDLIAVEIGQVQFFTERNMLLDLTPFARSDPDLHLERFYPAVLQRFRVKDRLIALPRDTAPICCLYYNRTLFRERGVPYPNDDWTWQEFLAAARKLTVTDPSGNTRCFGFVDDWPLWDGFVLSNGGAYVDDPDRPGRIELDSPQALEAIQFRYDLIYRHRVMPSPLELTGRVNNVSADLFVTGQAAMFFSGLWKTPYVRQSARFDWDIALFPRGPSGPRRFPTGGSGYALVRSTTHAPEAYALLAYLSSARSQGVLAKTGLLQPADQQVARSKFFLDGKVPRNKAILLRAVDQVVYHPHFEHWNDLFMYYLNPALEKIWNGAEEPTRLFRQAIEGANQAYFPSAKKARRSSR